jgi:superfamily II DNA or RNA helicase
MKSTTQQSKMNTIKTFFKNLFHRSDSTLGITVSNSDSNHLTIKKQLRDYQVNIVNAQDAFMKDPNIYRATIYAATGAGKTVCFEDLVIKQIKKNPNIRILIAHPRLALSDDQQLRMSEAVDGAGVEFTAFHSGQIKVRTLDNRKNLSTTIPEKLKEIQNQATSAHITFSSYHSLYKIANLKFDLIICDEAHYLCQEDFRKNLHKFRKKTKVLFYTATPVWVSAQEERMDNVELFGKNLAGDDCAPSSLIKRGYIVSPEVRVADIRHVTDGNIADYAQVFGTVFKDQAKETHPSIPNKMLVAMPNTLTFDSIRENIYKIRKAANDRNIDVYFITAVDSRKNDSIIFNERVDALNDFKNNTNPSIIVHCDTLAEGIDVDGITGVLIMRGMNKSKAIQTIGRAVRPAKADLVGSEVVPYEKRIKKKAIVTIGKIDGWWAGEAGLIGWIEMFRDSGYGELVTLLDPTYKYDSVGEEVQEAEDILLQEAESIEIVAENTELFDQIIYGGLVKK